MITGDLKNRIDQLWTTFWTGGLTNPLDVVEQMTYLMFIHDLDEYDDARAKEAAMLGMPYKSIFDGVVEFDGKTFDASTLKWSTCRDFDPDRMFEFVGERVFPFIKSLDASNKESAFSTYELPPFCWTLWYNSNERGFLCLKEDLIRNILASSNKKSLKRCGGIN